MNLSYVLQTKVKPKMPNVKRSHEENRRIVCIFCASKAKTRPLTEKLCEIISHVCDEAQIDFNDPRMPAGICNGCHFRLHDAKSGKLKPSKLEPIFDPTTVFITTPNCECRLCKIGRTTLNTPRPRKVGKPAKKSSVLCGNCLADISDMMSHTCKIGARRGNLLALAAGDEKGSQHIAVDTFKKAPKSPRAGSAYLSQAKGGRPLRVALPSSSALEKAQISAQKLLRAQLSTGISNRARKSLAAALNSDGRIVERGYQKKLLELSRKTQDCFTTTEISIGEEGKKYIVAHCKDLESYIDVVHAERKKTIKDVKIGIDSGQDFLKVTISLMGDPEDVDEDGLKDGGVLKLHIVAIAENLAESYEAIRALLELINAERVRFFLACDMKVANICVGIQNHASSFPCPWCLAQKSALGIESDTERTIGNIIDSCENFKSAGKAGAAKNFFNCVHKPLFNEDHEMKILDIIPPMQLHLLLGVTNTLFKAVERKSPTIAKKWLAEIGVEQNPYHGGDFNGNACRKLLQTANKLETLLPKRLRGKCSEVDDLKALIKCIRAFNKVVSACFGVSLQHDYEMTIFEFQDAFMELREVSVTPKVHAVFFHVLPFLQGKMYGLGYYSEQAVETAHSLFKVHWVRYKRPKGHPTYAQQLLKCINDFNSKHM